MGWKKPTAIQRKSLPPSLEGKDVIGLAETGSGKTGAYLIPILQSLRSELRPLQALILVPTRELAFQIDEQIHSLGGSFGVMSVVVIGKVEMIEQSLALARQPHIVVATPGRLVDHLENTKGFHLRGLRFLVLDEADMMLDMNFEEPINTILKRIPSERQTFLFSATMTRHVQKLKKVSLKDPVEIQVSQRYQTVPTLVQYCVACHAKHKECYLVHLLNKFVGKSAIVFTETCLDAQKLTLMLRNLSFPSICLHGQMSQEKRLNALEQFKSGSKSILLATDVASRGLDIPNVDFVVNYDVPSDVTGYVHRVGRTARAGQSGTAFTLVTQYDLLSFSKVEKSLAKKLPAYEVDEGEVVVLSQRVGAAQHYASSQMKEAKREHTKKRRPGSAAGPRSKRSRADAEDEEDESLWAPTRGP